MDDSVMYTGVDNDNLGMFGNEVKDEATTSLIQEQERKIRELEPKLQIILDRIESEKKLTIDYITGFVDNCNDKAVNISEIKATARYRKYLDELKTKFTLDMNEAKK